MSREFTIDILLQRLAMSSKFKLWTDYTWDTV